MAVFAYYTDNRVVYMKKINEDIKNSSFEGIYLIYGEEAYLKNQYKNKLKEAIVGDDGMNYSYFEGDLDYGALEDMVVTMPFFADKRLIVIDNSKVFKPKKKDEEGAEKEKKSEHPLEKILDKKIDEVVIVFVEEEADLRNKLVKKIAKEGYVCKLDAQDENILKRWVKMKVAEQNSSISDATATYLIDCVGTNMENLISEIDKLTAYTFDKKEITKSDIDDLCVKNLNTVVFAITNNMMEKKVHKVLKIFNDLLAQREHPMHILYLLTGQFNIIYQISCLKEKGLNPAQIAGKLNIKEARVKVNLPFTKNFSKTTIKAALEDFCDYEEKVKSGRIDEVVGLETLLVKYSS